MTYIKNEWKMTHTEYSVITYIPHPMDRMYVIAWPGDPEPVTPVGEPCHG